MLSKLKAKYAALNPQEQQQAKIAMIVGCIAVIICIAYFTGSSTDKKKPVDVSVGIPQGKTVLSMDDKLLEKSMTLKQAQDGQELDALKQKVAMLEGKGGAAAAPGAAPGETCNLHPNGQAGTNPAAAVQPLDQIIQQKNQQTAAPATAPKKQKVLPPLPAPAAAPAAPAASMPTSFNPPPPPAASGQSGPYYQPAPVERRRAGGIGVAVNDAKGATSTAATTAAKGDDGKKKEKDRPFVYLAPSFMEATTLNGLNAPTSDAGRNNPMPVFMRVAAPAILPNEVKANLKGCFVIGEAVGSPSDQRAHVRLVSISCLSKKGQAVIDQDITGFVQDQDGGIGLTGQVVWKAGAAAARLVAVSLLKGFGDAMSSAATSSNITPLGQVNTMGTTARDVGLNTAGSALASSAKGIAKIYEDMTLGSLPVVEVGNHKRITLMITKGVNLEIKNFKSVPWN
ncbi:TraB/VirB10 family protein [Geomonas subterranea]|uniref:TraB/VirB10 family protein n=1 Tax=Geomonas subterranea TaxID=2847989 RepID=UPI001CD1AC50|nr:TraB/VirB10 family protein [Geomonas fuzhouensis]